ncbi:FIVAR domain-containing protein [Gardnerella vaginalis]|uniref:FIVAR domain-containing protein n=1 Tax=Gardnerella vaginalis TaxID=2702 RepID=UPI000C7D1981|nr:FIVAR domain-containing protein [Gardnerella vaginalis]NSX30624.1 FIVAR domain-containing protein [Gardnerella vaginalis]PKZ46423.1 peptidase [Gardnerella vaginalis]
MTTKSAKHANKTFGSAKDKSAKAVDMRKVAALSAGAAGVIAGAAIAFGATPAMAAETPASAPVNTNDPAKEQSVIANKKKAEGAEASKKTATETNKKEESKKEQPEQTKPTEQTVVKTEGKADATKTESGSKVERAAAVDNKVTNSTSATDKTNADSSTTEETSTPAENVVKKRTRRATVENKQPEATNDAKDENQKQGEPVVGTDREANPAPAPKVNSEITLSKETKDTLPNMYAWGSSDNVYIEKGQNQEVTFNFAKPSDGSTITKVAIFPSDGNTVDNAKSRKFLEYYSANENEHKPYSGKYEFIVNTDGSAKLTMTKLYSEANMAAEKYTANRCIYVYGTKDGKESVLYKTNIVRAATLVPPKTAGSIVLKYNEELTAQQIQDKLKAALDSPTEATGKKSIRAQIDAASRSNGVGGRTGENGAFVQTPDTAENKVIINDQRAYNPTEVTRFNRTTSKEGAAEKTYITTVQTLKTHLITDTGYTSDDLPLTVARYDTRIEKPIVDDLSKVSDDVKTEIKRKLAHLNHVSQDQVTINDQGEVTINFADVDAADAPKIALRDLVLKKIAEKDVVVPENDKAVFVANPLGYSNAELDRIKTAIYEANKDNKELGLTSKDQITLEYLKGDLTASGDSNKGISNGQAENKITVKIKTDKSVAEFTSNVKESKLTKLPNIRTDYTVSWDKTKIDGRDTDEGISWSNDQKTTIIYRYDPTKAQEFDTTKILGLLKAKPKDSSSGLRDLTGGEQLSYEGTGNNARKSHMNYALNKDGEPTTELTLGNMGGAYWSGNQKVSNSDVNLGDNLSIAGSYSWDPEAGSVTVAGKKDKIFKARLFVEPYAMTYYKHVYMEKDRHPGNTAKAINVIFVPQTNHKTADLKTSIGEHKTTKVDNTDVPTDSKYYNASDAVKKDYEDALKVAKQTLEKVGTTPDDQLTEQLKAEVDNATIKLDKARKALDGDATKKDELDKSITEDGTPAEGQQATTGTKASDKYKNVSNPDFKTADGKPDTKKNDDAKAAKKAYDEALAEAEKVKADNNATQKAVDEAKAKLDAAREKLNEFSTNKDKLNAAIAEHGKVNTGEAGKTGDEKLKTADPAYQNATPDERTAYDNAVKKANDLLANPNASQKEVNEAIAALEKAKKDLDAKATDKSQLITAEKLTFDNPDKDDANKQSTFYKNALNKQTNGASEQEKQAAKTAVENYDNALAKAREVLKNDKATQKEVDAAKDALTKAEDALHKDYATDANELTKVLADNFSGYLMPAYFNAFDKAQAGDADAKKAFKDYNDAYQKAKALKEDLEKAKNGGTAPGQKQIDEAKKALEEARKVIDKYATNTSRLSAAVFNDIAIQHSPAYANVSADDASAEAKAAKTKYEKAVEKLNQALNKQMPKDQANGKDIPDTNIPDKNGNLDDKDYLKNIQAHAQGEPLDRDITSILKEMNDAIADLNKFATKTDDLLKSVNEHDNTKQTPAYKNASHPDFKNDDGTTADKTKNDAAQKAVDEYGEALNVAKELLKNPAATQKQVNDALNTLNEKRKALDTYNTDTTKLKESVGKHGSTDGAAPTEGTQTSDAYRNASDPHFMKEEGGKLVPDKDKNDQAAAAKKAYDEALTKAQELLKKHDDKDTPQDAKPTQKDINDALKALDDARTEIEKYKTDTTALNAEAEKSQADTATTPTAGQFEDSPEFKNAKAKTSDGNENTDVTAYKNALANARKLVSDAKDASKKNSERPTQQQINDALDALKAAKKQITDNYKTNLEPLTSAKDFADGDFKKTPEYQNAVAKKTAGDQGATNDLGQDNGQTGFDNILKKVADKLNDNDWKQKATQKEVSALLKQLQDAQDKIAKTYKTDAIKLEREVGDKDQDGKPVVPPFEASVTYKNALEKAKTEDPATTDANSATKKLKEYTDKLKDANDLIEKVKNPDPNAKPEDRPTQKQVDDALAALKKAKQDIDNNFKTKVDDLQKEVDDKDDKGTVKDPTFEKTTEFANLQGKTKDGKKPDDLVAYEQALAKAKDLIDKNDGKVTKDGQEVDVPKDQLPSQKEVDEAQKALKEIKDKILANYKTNPHDLQQEVDLSKDGDDDQRDTTFENTPEFKNADAKKGEDGKDNADMAAYKKALDDAKKLLDKFDRTTGKPKTDLPNGEKAPTQKELDDALQKLQDAKKKITEGYKTDSSKLKSEAGKDSDFTKTPEYQNAQAKGDDASKQALEDYKKALEDANKVLGDKDATQAQVDEALKKLQDAKKKLSDGYKTDKTDLRQEAGKDSDFTKSPEYQNAAGSSEAEAYKRALDEANAVLKNPNATQAEVDEALKKLQDAKQKLTDSHKTDKSDLNTEAGNDPDFRKSIPFIIGKAADLAEYQQALNDANSVLKDPNATQAQVNQALRRLRDAKQKLIDAYNRLINSGSGVGDNTGVGVNDSNNTSVNNVVDKSALQAEVDQALGDVSANASGVVADSNLVSEFNAALNYARLVLSDANATQGQVDSALARLRAARAALREGMLAARDSAGVNLKRGDVSGVNTGASSSVFAALAAVFAGLGVAGAASKRRKHSAR